jgi:signal peptidase I
VEKRREKKMESMKSKLLTARGEFFRFWLPVIATIMFVRGTIAEARFIPSSSMEPTLQIQDRILVEKVSNRFLGRPIKHGDILVFYPPAIETGITGSPRVISSFLPFIPERPPAFIKRVVGLPGDRIVVRAGDGIFVNGERVPETGDIPKPDYDLNTLGDIGGTNLMGHAIEPFGSSTAPIVVPDGKLFMLGDNHNNSADSHVWGFVDASRVVGRDCLTFWHGEWLPLSKIFARS